MNAKARPGKYYILTVENPDGMLLGYVPDPTDNSFVDIWNKGSVFSSPIIHDPFVVEIQDDYKDAQLLPFFDVEPVMSYAFYEALLEAGVNNLVPYECILRSEDGTVEHKGFKIVNIVGLIRAAGKGTKFTGESRLIDASMDKIDIDETKAGGALMFRMAEAIGTIVVHETVKKYLESKNFPSIIFRDPGDTLVL